MTEPTPPEFLPLAWTTPNGTALTLRQIRADDVALLTAFVGGLSYGARYFRYGRGDIEFTAEEFRHICTPNPRECVHLLVVKSDGAESTVVASARIVFAEGDAACEVATTVADAWQLHGIGKRLIDALFDQARVRNMTEMHGRILASNRRMIEFMRRRGFAIADSAEGPSLKIARRAILKI